MYRSVDPNREIYNTKYSDKNLALEKAGMFPYDREIIQIRLELLRRYGAGKVVLDLCCGTGVYLLHEWGLFRQAIGIDFSSKMLSIFKEKISGHQMENLFLIQGDAREVPLRSASVDFIYSFTSLYYVYQVSVALAEIGRILKPGGVAVFELGNRSLNTYVCEVAHRQDGIAKSFHVSYPAMLRAIQEANLAILEQRVFQLLPLWGAGPLWLRPLASQHWKRLLGIKIRGRMLDEWLSSRWPLRCISFRHLFICQKN